MTTELDAIGDDEVFIPWARSLRRLPADRWLAPIASDIWSIGEVVARLLARVRFILTERRPCVRSGADLPAVAATASGDVVIAGDTLPLRPDLVELVAPNRDHRAEIDAAKTAVATASHTLRAPSA